ncbi:MAG: pentapeptide repeat-containing protein, partial [bacterium]
ADIQANFRANKTKFRNDAFFVGTSIAQNAEFDSATFSQKIHFDKAAIGGNFSAKNALFAYQYGTLYFTKLHVGEDASFDGAQFASQADFQDADIKGRLDFKYTRFDSNLLLNDASFKNFTFNGMDSTVSRIPRIDLSRTLINRDFTLEKVQVEQLLARHLSVKGQTSLKEVRVHKADFLLSEFQTLRMSEVRWPKTASQFELAGMSYNHIGYENDVDENPQIADKNGLVGGRVESKFSSEDSLISMVKQSRFSPGTHNTLETYFRNEGNKQYADKIFVAQKRRERQNYQAWISLDWWLSTILWAIAGYGRYPQLALLWSALFVTIGCYFFRDQDGMKLQRPDRHQPDQFKYNPFWYSLDLFVPVIDLKAASIWQPKSERWFVRHYMRLHSVLGWLLIPIGLAALSGLIK